MNGYIDQDYCNWKYDIPSKRMYDYYCEYAKGTGIRKVPDCEFGKKLKEMCPSMEKKYMRVKMFSNDTHRKRENVYVVPQLEICRNEFEKYIDMEIDWPEEVDEDCQSRFKDATAMFFSETIESGGGPIAEI